MKTCLIVINIEYNNVYKGISRDYILDGCYNDGKLVDTLFSQIFNIDKVIYMLDTKDVWKNNPSHFPTKKNIRDNILNASKDYDTIIITYAGHGVQQRDQNGDESKIDQDYINLNSNNNPKDSCLVTHEIENTRDHLGYLVDDDINATLKQINEDKMLMMIIDCCHSGTIGDLKHNYYSDKNNNSLHSYDNPSAVKSTVCIMSGGRDSEVVWENIERYDNCTAKMQTLLDNANLKNAINGYFTFNLCNEIVNNNNIVISNIVQNINQKSYDQMIQVSYSNKNPVQVSFYDFITNNKVLNDKEDTLIDIKESDTHNTEVNNNDENDIDDTDKQKSQIAPKSSDNSQQLSIYGIMSFVFTFFFSILQFIFNYIIKFIFRR